MGPQLGLGHGLGVVVEGGDRRPAGRQAQRRAALGQLRKGHAHAPVRTRVSNRAHPLGGQLRDLDVHPRTSSVDRMELGEPAVETVACCFRSASGGAEVQAAARRQAQATSIAGAEL